MEIINLHLLCPPHGIITKSLNVPSRLKGIETLSQSPQTPQG